MAQIAPYLTFAGTCREAFTFYHSVLGGTITHMLSYGETPMAGSMPTALHAHIAHARLDYSGQNLMGGDAPPDHFRTPQGFSVNLTTTDTAEAERLFHALAEGGQVHMPIAPTFWAARFGMLVDRFGTPWMVNCELPG